MDWMHLAELLGLAAAAGYAEVKRRRARGAEAARIAAEAAADHAAELAIAELEKAAQKAVAEFEDMLKKKLGTKTAGGALLTRLSVQREAAIRKGKELALRTYREKMAEP